jgi:hypothetical protein
VANLALLNELFDQAANDPEHNQISWRTCIAGMAVAQRADFAGFEEALTGVTIWRDTDGKAHSIDKAAREALDLTAIQAADLFFAGLSGDWDWHDKQEVRAVIERIEAEELVSA